MARYLSSTFIDDNIDGDNNDDYDDDNGDYVYLIEL
jgi:hypothetical protein